MNIETIPVGVYEVNCYVLWGEARRALVIDPGADAERILGFLRERELRLSACLLTHGHADHSNALAAVQRAAGGDVGMHPAELTWIFSAFNQIPPHYPIPERPATIARHLEDGQHWTDADLAYEVLATPGHSPGSVCFHFPAEQALFSGDTLFQGSVGRTDLRGGDGRLLAASLRRLRELPEATRVYPGHGPATTIGEERRSNFYLRGRA